MLKVIVPLPTWDGFNMPNQQEIGVILNSYGVSSSGGGISAANIMADIIFGVIGMCAFYYGRKEKAYRPIVIGLVLMIYPYFIQNTLFLYLIGAGFTAGLYFWRD